MAEMTPITPPRVPLTNPQTGLIAREWYLFFLSLFTQAQSDTSALAALERAPPTIPVDTDTLLTEAQLSSGVLPSDLGPIFTALQALEASQQVAFDPTDLQTSLQALKVAPMYTPQLPRLRYGSFYDTTDQTAAAINTAYGMTFNTTDITNGVYIGSPTSRVYVDTVNIYNIQFSAQLINVAGGAHNAWIWLRKNGTDIPNSATVLRVEGNNTEAVAAWNFLLSMNAGDYFELMWEVSDLSLSLHADPATAVHPAIPSIILTVTDNISSRGAT